MAFSIALYVRDHALKLHTEGMELNKLAINNMGNTQGAYNARQANLQSNPWKQNIGGKDEDLTWLI